MRIIAGSCKGRPIQAPKGMDTRPTLDRVKESLFGIIQFEIYGRRVLDLFAGSGNLGLEALSRGASFAAFNDANREANKVIKANIEKLGFGGCSAIYCMDYAAAVAASVADKKGFDIVFLDPPYKAGLMENALAALLKHSALRPNALVVAEHDAKLAPNPVDGFLLKDRRIYRDTAISFYIAQGRDKE